MANVAFKLGTQAALNTIATSKAGQEGSFYLTSDSHRLYIGLSTGDIASVNEGVITVPNIASLPDKDTLSSLNAGNFYYATTENILCVFNGRQWVQINPDTTINNIEITATATNNIASVVTKLTDTSSNTFSDSVEFKGISGNQITVTPAAGSNPPQIIISGDVYKLQTDTTPESEAAPGYNTANIKLHSQNQSSVDSKLTIAGGAGVNVKSDSTTGVITINAENSGIKTVAFNPLTDGGYKLTITDNLEVPHEGIFNPTFKYGKDGDNNSTTSTHFDASGALVLDVYTSGQVEQRLSEELKSIDALVFKGTVGGGGTVTTLPTSQVSVGDLYKVISSGTFGGHECKVGDMLIAQGTEDPNTGFITGTITWTYIPSGDEADTTYIGSKIIHGLKIVQVGNTGNIIATFAVSADDANPIQLTDDASADNTSRNVKIAHKQITQNNTTGTPVTQAQQGTVVIPVETQVIDAYGHVTGTKTITYTLKDTHNGIKAMTSTVAAASNKATVTLTTSMTDGDSANTAFAISSTNLTINKATGDGSITVNLEWGSF